MRFRLATTGQGGQDLYGGLGRGMQALFSLPMLRAQAAEEAQNAAMRRQSAEAQIANNMAQAAIREEERKQLAGRGDVLNLMGATRAGMSVPEFTAAMNERTQGAPDMGPRLLDAPIPGVGPSGRTASFDDAILTLYGPAAATPADKTNWDQLANARGRYQQQDAVRDIVANPAQAARYGQAYAATEGKPLVDNVGNTGAGFNRFTGQGVTIDPAMRALFGEEGAALVKQRNAAAGASGASAALSNARRERVTGGYDKPVTIIDEDSGEASVTRMPTGAQPVTVGVAPKKQTGTDATNAKERNRVVRDVEKELVGASDAEIQAEVDRRMTRRGAPGKAAPAAPAAPEIDMNKANKIKADVKAGTITREQGLAQLRALGFK